MGTSSEFDVYPDRRKVGFDHGRGESFVDALGRHDTVRLPPEAREIEIEIVKAPIGGLGPFVPFRVPASAYNGRTAKGRARRS